MKKWFNQFGIDAALARLSEAKDEVTRIKNRATQADWRAYEGYSAAVAKAGSGEVARAALFADGDLQKSVEKVEALNKEQRRYIVRRGVDIYLKMLLVDSTLAQHANSTLTARPLTC